MFEITGKYTTAKVMIDGIEESCMSQIMSFTNHPVFTNPIAMMPDTHAGRGAAVGFVMKMTDKIIPATIGVDISCGVRVVNIGPELNMPLEEIDHKIRQRVPFGMNMNDRPVLNMQKEFPWHKANVLAEKFRLAYQEEFNQVMEPVFYDINWFLDKVDSIGANRARIINSLGSLGGGNHAIEVGSSTYKGNYWVMIHTGSRNFGKCICEYWQNKAVKKYQGQSKEEKKGIIADLKRTYTGKELYEKIKAFKNTPENTPHKEYPDDLCWLEDSDVHGYLQDMIFAQIYAEVNRDCIMNTILNILDKISLDTIEVVHNYIDFQDFIIRKGAVRAYAGERFALPLNMRDGVLICTGRGNQDWLCSGPHGSGRFMSRSAAKKNVDLDKFKEQMKDIFSTSVGRGTLDEAPDAYKDSKLIEDAIEPTAVIIDRIKPVLNMKASEEND
jgi:RNA-splicing ligase RtcB